MKSRAAAAAQKSKRASEHAAGSGAAQGPTHLVEGNGTGQSSPESAMDDGRSPGGVLSQISGSLDLAATPDQHQRAARRDLDPNTAIALERSSEARGPALDQTIGTKPRNSRQSNVEGKLSKRKDKSFQLHQ